MSLHGGFVSGVIFRLCLSAQSGIDCWREPLGDDDEKHHARIWYVVRCFSTSRSTFGVGLEASQSAPSVAAGSSGLRYHPHAGFLVWVWLGLRPSQWSSCGWNTGSLPINSAGEAVLLNGSWTTMLY